MTINPLTQSREDIVSVEDWELDRFQAFVDTSSCVYRIVLVELIGDWGEESFWGWGEPKLPSRVSKLIFNNKPVSLS